MYILDTCILIDYERLIKETVHFLDILKPSDRNISIITWMEFIKGSRNKDQLNLLEKFLNNFNIIQINNDISKISASLIKKYHLSDNLTLPDAIIAATAISTKNTLITNNIKDFRVIKGLNIMPTY